jgi:hypothetical protein
MKRAICLIGLCLAVGCGGTARRDPEEVYEAALRANLPANGDGEGYFVSVDGKDPSEEMLGRLRKQWPALRPVSETPKRGYHVISVGKLEWVWGGANVRVGSSNGMDGHLEHVRLVWKNGQWEVESRKTEAVS